jgi:hypothetical protein
MCTENRPCMLYVFARLADYLEVQPSSEMFHNPEALPSVVKDFDFLEIDISLKKRCGLGGPTFKPEMKITMYETELTPARLSSWYFMADGLVETVNHVQAFLEKLSTDIGTGWTVDEVTSCLDEARAKLASMTEAAKRGQSIFSTLGHAPGPTVPEA